MLLCIDFAFRNRDADMAAVYYERVDVEGHHYGPWSDQRKNATKAVDQVLQSLHQQIRVIMFHRFNH